MTGSQITAVGAALPERELSNFEIARGIGRDETWIEERTGIRARRIAAPSETSAVLGTAAAQRALESVGRTGVDVDLIICATVTPQHRFPATASLIQHALGSRAAAFDLNAGCSGFLYALAQADASIRSGSAERVLVVGADVMSTITDYTDPKTAILFGDGAGAVLVERSDDHGSLGPFLLFSDGSRPELLYVDRATNAIRMEGREVYRAAIASMADSVAQLMAQARVSADQVALVIAHQANSRILASVAERLALPREKMFSNIHHYGNTSAASIPIALFEAHQTGAVADGDLVVLTAFGAGFVWGAALVRWASPRLTAGAAAVTELADV